MEKGINFKIDEKLYKTIKIKIAKEGISLKEYFLTLINNDLKNKESN